MYSFIFIEHLLDYRDGSKPGDNMEKREGTKSLLSRSIHTS